MRHLGLRQDRRIEGRVGPERENLAVVRVHRDEGAGEAERRHLRLAHRLQVGVDRQHQVVPGLGLAHARLAAGRQARGVDVDRGQAVDAAQDVVVARLEALLAHLVARLELLEAGLAQLLRRDLADVAEDVRGRRAVRVAADVDAVDGHPGVAVLVLAQEPDELDRDVALERDRARGQLLRLLPDLLADLGDPHPGDLRHALQHLGAAVPALRQLVRAHLQGEGGAVANQHLAVAVADLAAGRLHGHLAHAVALRLGQVLVAGQHLEVPEPEEDHPEYHQREAADHGNPRMELRRVRAVPVPAAALEGHAAPPGTPAERRSTRGLPGRECPPRRLRKTRRLVGGSSSTSAGRSANRIAG